ncbi:MAG: 30S ribosomal protein S9 [SAR324 cluster bacterium]|uniref:Small ribosomal subunit protein uS9 n=1 Tax=SAR324 cluster bacterium TaxID=2024889 RepID=A0A7X9ILN2_9DELT|nr:30S ribosomal protein S9 [SAR324 cluster bacterium]
MRKEVEKGSSKGGVIHCVGKRKRAIARVFLKPGEGKIVVNGKPFQEYFGRAVLQQIAKQSLEATNQLDKLDVNVIANGGGLSGQAGAIRHGIARALIKMDEANRKTLRAEGLVTRDAREVERKKFGRHKARKRPQFSKR